MEVFVTSHVHLQRQGLCGDALLAENAVAGRLLHSLNLEELVPQKRFPDVAAQVRLGVSLQEVAGLPLLIVDCGDFVGAFAPMVESRLELRVFPGLLDYLYKITNGDYGVLEVFLGVTCDALQD